MTHDIPVSLLETHDLAERFPDRAHEIYDEAKKKLHLELWLVRESRLSISWHPFHTTKAILIAGLIAFLLCFFLSQVVAVGKLYAQAKGWTVSVPIPILGTETLNLGAHVPTSTALGVAAQLPSYGWLESLYVAIAVMVTALIERFVLTIIQWKKILQFREAERQLARDLATLTQWQTL